MLRPRCRCDCSASCKERELQRVGAETVRVDVRVDVRVVAATNRSLEEMVGAGTFREDLYYRIAIFPIELPPLRERPEEIRPLASHLLRRHAALMHREPPRVPEEAWRVLESQPWPGNVRQLESFLQRALILSPGESLIVPDLPGTPLKTQEERRNAVPGRWDEEVRELIRRALLAAGGKVYGPDGAAMLLGLPPTTLQGKMRRYRCGSTGSPRAIADLRAFLPLRLRSRSPPPCCTRREVFSGSCASARADSLRERLP